MPTEKAAIRSAPALQPRFVCPACRFSAGGLPSVIESNQTSWDCPGCRKQYSIIEGILDFAPETPYYGEMSQESMRNLLTAMEKKNWKEVIHEQFAQPSPWIFQIITDESRADWQFLLPLDKSMAALDVGSGWGTISIPLAHRCGFVVAMDGTLERCLFVRERCQQDEVNNLYPIRANILDCPLEPNQFDLVVFNGSFEWIGESRTEGDPEQLQRTALHIAHGLCKKGGYLYMGIENRYGFKYLAGFMDDHTGLKKIGFLPRKEANELSQRLRGKPYRTYTYSYSEYEQLLSDAGFQNTRFYYPIPDYKSAQYLAPLGPDGRRARAWFFNSLYNAYEISKSPWHNQAESPFWRMIGTMESIANETGTIHHFAASFSIIAQKV